MGMSTDGMAITPFLHSWAYDQTAPLKANKYMAFYKNKKTDVCADTSLEAQTLAANYFRTKKRHEVTVVLIEKNNQPIIHTPE